MEVREQLVDSSGLLPLWGSRGQTEVTRLGVRHFDMLSYLMGPCLLGIHHPSIHPLHLLHRPNVVGK